MKKEARILLVYTATSSSCAIVVRDCRLLDWVWCGSSRDFDKIFSTSTVRHEVKYYFVCSGVDVLRGFEGMSLVKPGCAEELCGFLSSLVEELRALKRYRR